MVKEQQLEQLFGKQENIRLVSVIAHVDHGKSTLTDSLLALAGMIDQDQAGNKRATDTMEEEKERGITIRSTGVTMAFNHHDERCIVHLVDSPGHVDFSSEVTAALRVSDGAIVVVDCVEGVCVQTETVLRQALSERVRPILVLNKIDRAILELQLSPEDAYTRFCDTIAAANKVMEPFTDSALGDITFAPEKGNVVFASGLFGWGVTLPQFAKHLVNRGNNNMKEEEREKMISKVLRNLWGDTFYNPETKKIVHSTNSNNNYNGDKTTSNTNLERYTCKMFLGPLFKLIRAIMNDDKAQMDEMLPRIDVVLSTKEREEKTGKALMRTVMQKFLPLSLSLVDIIFSHLPSPRVAQKYRAEILYDGDLDDEFGKAIKECDPNGPVVAFISKMVPVPNTRSFYAFGRIFSGTLSYGQKVYAINPSKKEEASKNVQRLIPLSIRATDNLQYCACGNIVIIQGIDSLLVKCGTISSSATSCPIKNMNFSVSPIVRVSVRCKNAQDLPKLIEGIRALVNVDPSVQTVMEEEQIVICAVGDLHLQVCMSVLRKEYCPGIEIIESSPMVPFRETITSSPPEPLLAKSANKHNRVYAQAVPLSHDLCDAIEKKEVNVERDTKKRAEMLIAQFGWDDVDAKKKIWCFAPEGESSNVIVDATRAAQYLNEISDSIVGAFKWATQEGPLCGEPLRGVRINITDVSLHADAVHRSARQITPCVRRVTHACVLASSPRVVEPMLQVEVVVTTEESGKVYNVIQSRRGVVFFDEPRFGTPLCTLRAHLPVLGLFGLNAELRERTRGQAFTQASFSHWQVMEGDPYKEGSLPNTVVKDVRARKGLPAAIPKWQDYVDRL